MNLFSRITATIGATAETAVSRFENHDAIAQSALIEARQAVAKARIRHQRLKRSVEDIRKSLDDTEKQVEQWTVRAKKIAITDEVRALQCVEQRQLSREQLENHKQNLSKHEALEADMAGRLKEMETRLQSMTSQRDEMRSRESIARATQVMDRIDNHSRDGVDAVFERWELAISDSEVRNEVLHDDQPGVSALQRELDEEDRQAALKEELAALLVGKQENNHE
ncbi:MAG: PspA/IM30 family protein [Granulosicoccus sp.]